MSLACLALHNARVRVPRGVKGRGQGEVCPERKGWAGCVRVAIICSAAILSISVPIRVCRSHVDKRSTLGLSTMNRLYLPTVGRFTLCLRGRRAAPCIYKAVARPPCYAWKTKSPSKTFNWSAYYRREPTDRPIFLQKIAWQPDIFARYFRERERIYLYIYISLYISLSIYLYVSIYLYIYIYREREGYDSLKRR